MKKHLNSKVVYFLLLIILVGFTASAFRYYQNIPCEGFSISLENKPYFSGELISFKDMTTGAKDWKWSFGDSTDVKTGREVLHKFKNPGKYTVSLVINGVCEAAHSITVVKQKIVSPETIHFIAPKQVAVGESFRVSDTTSTSKSWEWRFDDDISQVATGRQATHFYDEAGTKTIRLIVNGSDHVSFQTIDVYEKEVVLEPVKKIKVDKKPKEFYIKDAPDSTKYQKEGLNIKDAPKIDGLQLINQLKLYAAGQATQSSFMKYFCNGLRDPITTKRKGVNTFLDLCQDIKGREIEVKSIDLIRIPGENCIENLTIDYRRKGKLNKKAIEKIKSQAGKIPMKPGSQK